MAQTVPIAATTEHRKRIYLGSVAMSQDPASALCGGSLTLNPKSMVVHIVPQHICDNDISLCLKGRGGLWNLSETSQLRCEAAKHNLQSFIK